MNISVALCTYNGARYLREQLDSIARQTLLPDELVVCDDRSSDNTIRILEEFRDQVSFPVHIHLNEKNLGSTKNFEKAISLCRGEIIALCDQDDIWKPGKLERFVETFKNNPEAGYVFSDAELIDETGAILNHRIWDSLCFRGETQDKFLKKDQFNCLIKQSYVTGATMAFRAQVGKRAMPFPTKGRWIHDGWIALVASSVGDWGVPIDEALVVYRQHAQQQVGVPNPGKKVIPSEKSNHRRSLVQIYREFKVHRKIIYKKWEEQGAKNIAIFSVIYDKLTEIEEYLPSAELAKNLDYLNKNFKQFELHYLSRKKILTSRDMLRYPLIFREALSGRYGRYSDSWRSIFRDLFLG